MPVNVTTPEDLRALENELRYVDARVAALEVAPPDPAIAQLQAAVAALDVRVKALENPNPPPPPPPPPPPAGTELNVQLVGGYRLKGEFSRAQLAMDHATKRAFITGHGQRNEVHEYQLPNTMGAGTDYNAWPIVVPTKTIQGWWTGGYGSGIMFQNGQLKVAPKMFYDMAPPPVTTIFAQDGTSQVVNVPRQRFAGFVKGLNTIELGSGGYESGQGWARGPTLATMSGQILIDYPQNNDFAKCCPREPNYWGVNGGDSWVAFTPRKPDGTRATVPITDTTGLDGRWACDRITGGGIRLSHGVYYWAWMGTGDLNYNRQNETFAAVGMNRTYLYRYDPVTYALSGWKLWPYKPELSVRGQELSPDGKYLYLTRENAWKGGMYTVDPVLEVYEVK